MVLGWIVQNIFSVLSGRLKNEWNDAIEEVIDSKMLAGLKNINLHYNREDV